MKTKISINKELENKISFIAFAISEYAKSYKMSVKDAYNYLKKYGGLNYLYECWWGLHTENSIWAVYDINQVCVANGGRN